MEHGVAVLFALGFPAATAPSYSSRRAAILAGDRELKKTEYRQTIAWLSAMGVASVLFFIVTGRDLALLGVVWPDSLQGAASVGLAAAGSAILWIQVRAVRMDSATRAAAREALRDVREYFPSGSEERHLFRGVSFAAGIGEELFYRGFLFWYFAEWLPVWAIVVATSVLFGLAHIMHGTQALTRSTLMGFVLAGLYLLGGSLLAPMILHVAVDLTSGETGSLAFGDEQTVAL